VLFLPSEETHRRDQAQTLRCLRALYNLERTRRFMKRMFTMEILERFVNMDQTRADTNDWLALVDILERLAVRLCAAAPCRRD
jgi:hypothetical protein